MGGSNRDGVQKSLILHNRASVVCHDLISRILYGMDVQRTLIAGSAWNYLIFILLYVTMGGGCSVRLDKLQCILDVLCVLSLHTKCEMKWRYLAGADVH